MPRLSVNGRAEADDAEHWVRPDGGVFINYRKGPREDRMHVLAIAAVHERLARHFGSDKVFFDTRSMGPGERYPNALRARLSGADVLIAMIHPDWQAQLRAQKEAPVDWVRYEISAAIEAGIAVLPVLLNDTGLPPPDSLGSVRELALRQVCRISWRTFERDMVYLIRALETMVAPAWVPPDPEPERSRRISGRTVAGAGWVGAVLALAGPPLAARLGGWEVASGLLAAALGIVGVLIGFFGVVGALIQPAVVALVRPSDRVLQVDGTTRRTFGLVVMLGALTVPLLLLAVPFAINRGGNQAFLLVMVFELAVVGIGFVIVRSRPDIPLWPPSRPVTANEVSLRQSLAVLRQQLADPLAGVSRADRDQLLWLRGEVGQRRAELAATAGRSRRSWLTERHPGWLATILVWAGATTGLSLAAAVAGWWPALPPAVAAGCALIAAALLELTYRNGRRERAVLVREVDQHLAELDPLLPAPNRDPGVWVRTPGNSVAVTQGEPIHFAGFVAPGTAITFTLHASSCAVLAEHATGPANGQGFASYRDEPYDTTHLPAGEVRVVATFTDPETGRHTADEVARLMIHPKN